HSGDGPVELAALPRSQAGAEIASHKANLLWRRGGLHSRSQPPKSALIGGGTIQPDHFLDFSLAFLPKRLHDPAAPAPQVYPGLAGLRIKPVDGINQEFLVSGEFLLAPKGLGTAGVRPVIDGSGVGRRHRSPSLGLEENPAPPDSPNYRMAMSANSGKL